MVATGQTPLTGQLHQAVPVERQSPLLPTQFTLMPTVLPLQVK